MTTETRSLYSQLPAIDRLLRDSSFLSLRDTYGHTRVVELLRQMLDEAREVIRDSQTLPAWCENWAQEVDARLTKEAQSALRPVINLTGTVLHTNLGAGKRWWFLAANWWRLAARFVFPMLCVRQDAPYTK